MSVTKILLQESDNFKLLVKPEEIQKIFETKAACIISAERNKFDKKTNAMRSVQLKLNLRNLPYSFTEAFGGYMETKDDGSKIATEERSYMVWTDPEHFRKFKSDMMRLGAQFEQETILLKTPKDDQAYFIGTTDSNYLGLGEKDLVGRFVPNKKTEYYTRIGNFNFVFE